MQNAFLDLITWPKVIMFSYYTLQTKNLTRAIEKLKIARVGYLFGEECSCRSSKEIEEIVRIRSRGICNCFVDWPLSSRSYSNDDA